MSTATIGSALAERRQELGLEKGQAADKIGMSRTTYSSYEQDAQRPSVDVFPALAEFLNISNEELLSLYGATCVAAVRPAFERLLAENPDGVGGEPADEVAGVENLEAHGVEAEVVLEIAEAPPADESDSDDVPEVPGAVNEPTATEDGLDFHETTVFTESSSLHAPFEERVASIEVETPEAYDFASSDFEPSPTRVFTESSETDSEHHQKKKKKKKKKKH